MSRKTSERPRVSFYNVEDVKPYAAGYWREILSALGGINIACLNGSHQPCPKCGGKDRFRFRNELEIDGAVFCNGSNCIQGTKGNGFLVLEWLTGKTFPQVVREVGEYLGIPPSKTGKDAKSKNRANPTQNLKFLDWNANLIGIWCIWKLPITPEAIQQVGGRLALYRGQHTVIALPIWGEHLDTKEPVGWCLYNVTGANLPVKDNPNGVKIKTTEGSEAGIIGNIAKIKSGDVRTLWKLEGPSDLLTFLSLEGIPDSVSALTNAFGAKEKPSEWVLRLFSGKEAIVLHDADSAGTEGANGWTDKKGTPVPGWCQSIATITSDCCLASLPYEVVESHGKDLRDWCIESPRTYSELYQLTKQLIAAVPINEVKAKQSVYNPEDFEDDDDPNRLARVCLERLKEEGIVLRRWLGRWVIWTKEKGRYQYILGTNEDKEVRNTYLLPQITKEFHRLWVLEKQAYDSKKGSDAAEVDEPPPKVRKSKDPIPQNVLNACVTRCTLPENTRPQTWLDRQTHSRFISLKNGILDVDAFCEDKPLEECKLAHSPEWFSFISLPCNYDEDAKCEDWKKFLNSSLKDPKDQQEDGARKKIVQEWAGYLLLPDTNLQAFLFSEGKGGNGKSVFMGGLEALLGQKNCSSVAFENLGKQFYLHSTLDKLANFCSDVGEIDKTSEGLLKAFVSGESVLFEEKRQNPFFASPTARITMAGNNKPRFIDPTNGLWRRMILMPWLETVGSGQKTVGMDKPQFWESRDQVDGMFMWALDGLARLRENLANVTPDRAQPLWIEAFTYSKICHDAVSQYKEDSNPAFRFIKDNLETSHNHCVITQDVYEIYRQWEFDQGGHPLGVIKFNEEIKRYFRISQKDRIRIAAHHRELDYVWPGIAWSDNRVCNIETKTFSYRSKETATRVSVVF